MKTYLVLLFCIFSFRVFAQFTVQVISLPLEIADPNNQFSGLSIQNDKLFFLSESRIQENMEAKIFSVELPALERKMRDSTYMLPYQMYQLTNLEQLRNKLEKAGQPFEGLEAITIDSNNEVFLTIEAAPPSTNGYLIKGQLKDSKVIMDTTYLVALTKPTQANGVQICNAGFEAFSKEGDIAFYFLNTTIFLIVITVTEL